MPPGGPAGNHLVHSISRIGLRVWVQRSMTILTRALVLMVAVATVWMAIEVLGGQEVSTRSMLWIGFAAMIPALILAATSRPSTDQVARMLDRSFRLQERATTAVANIGKEIPEDDGPPSVVYLQVSDAANAVSVARSDSAFAIRPPVRELVLGIILALLLAALFFMRGGNGEIPDPQESIVPVFVPAAEQYVDDGLEVVTDIEDEDALTMEEIAEIETQSQNAFDDLQSLGSAFEDHGITHDIGTLIRQGDYEGAADQLRELAPQLPGLPESQRSSLAEDLAAASIEMSEDPGKLRDATFDAASSLQQGSSTTAEDIRSLATEIEQSAGAIVSSEDLEAVRDQEQQQSTSSNQNPQQGASSQGPSQGEESLFDQSDEIRDTQATESSEPGQSDGESEPGSSSAEPGLEGEPEGQQADGSTTTEPESGEGLGNSSSGEATEPLDESTGSGSDSETESASSTGPGQESDGQPEGEGAPSDGAGGETGDSSESESEGSSSGELAEPGEDVPEPTEGQPSDGSSDEAGEELGTEDPQQAVQLSRSPEGGDLQLGGSSGASSSGSGAGVALGGGNSVQGNVEEAGPDNNHVPAEYRSVVEAYFSAEE